jgi:polysaccharide export outer membrane protein
MAAQEVKDPPKDLVQYVVDARRQGVKESSIKQQALASGWSEAVVNEAIAYVNKLAPDTPAPSTPPSSTQAPVTPAPSTRAKVAPHSAEAPDTPKNRGVPDDYAIGAGDVLQISVWKEPDASVPSVVVRPDGKITMPVLKEVDVLGMTPTQAEKAITARLAKVINGADVTVVVTEINSKKVYVVGAVRKEGPLSYTYRMSVMQAISEAGGLNDYAKRKKIYILRTENGKEYRLPFNYDQVIRGDKPEQNIQLLPGDTLVVPH